MKTKAMISFRLTDVNILSKLQLNLHLMEDQERVNWEMGFSFLLTGKMGRASLEDDLGMNKWIEIGIVKHVNILNFSIFHIGMGTSSPLRHPLNKETRQDMRQSGYTREQVSSLSADYTV